MARKAVLLSVLSILVLGASSWSAPAYQAVNTAKDFYFGHISLSDIRGDGLDPVVLRDGAKSPEPAILNLPLGPGDIIRTSKERRIEIQFDNATVVRLDTDSELKIETILAQGLSSANKMSNLVLAKGRMFIMYKQYNSRELFQVLTPKAAIKFKHNAVGMITLTAAGATEVQMQYGKAVALYGADLKVPKELPLQAKDRAAFTADNRFALGEPLPVDDFESWNRTVNEDFDKLHQGKSTLPKPVQRLMPAVFNWAQRFGNRYGEWLFDDYFGYVWRPFYNDVYPWGSWQPYYAGRWSFYNNSMFWVGSEPWGWIPYHLGVWQWNSKRGWYWIPGSAFAPAWVDWAFFGSNWSWRPWSMWDWGIWQFDSMAWTNWMGYYDGWSYWGWRYPWTGLYGYSPSWGNPETGQPTKPVLGTISKDQLKKPANPPYALPRDYKSGVKAMMAALVKGDPAARESFLAQGRFASVVDRSGLLAPDVRSKAVPFESFRAAAAALPSTDPARALMNALPAGQTWSAYSAAMAVRTREADVPAGGGGRVVGGPATAPRDYRTMALRTIDWNPDVRMAQKIGASLRYSSGRNEIVCPELNLTSSNSRFSDQNRRNDGTYMGSGSSSGSSSSGGGDVSAGSASSGTSSGTASAGSSTSSGASTSTSTGSGHTVIK